MTPAIVPTYIADLTKFKSKDSIIFFEIYELAAFQ
jgi:hypothetical protein